MLPGKTRYLGPEPAEHAQVKDKQGKTALELAKDGKQEATLAVFKAYSVE
jgi:hypothetical protein